MFFCTLEGAEALMASAELATREFGVSMHRAVVDATDAGAVEARNHVHSVTGNLISKTEAKMLDVSPDHANGMLVSDTRYASYVESGTKAHDIYPKAGRGTMGPLRKGQSYRTKDDIGTHRVALRWYTGGQVHFARMVHHPGSRSFPFMGPAWFKMQGFLIMRMEDACARFVTRMA